MPRPVRVCTVPRCGQKHVGRGLCGLHYQAARTANHRDPRPVGWELEGDRLIKTVNGISARVEKEERGYRLFLAGKRRGFYDTQNAAQVAAERLVAGQADEEAA
jgi:hypothetical protein